MIGHIVVNVANVNSLDLRVIDGAFGRRKRPCRLGRCPSGQRIARRTEQSHRPDRQRQPSQSQPGPTIRSMKTPSRSFARIPTRAPTISSAHVPANATSFVDPQFLNGETYSYEVVGEQHRRKLDDRRTWRRSRCRPCPLRPPILHLTQLTTTAVGLAWSMSPNDNQTGIRIFRRDTTIKPIHSDRDASGRCHFLHRHRLAPRLVPRLMTSMLTTSAAIRVQLRSTSRC